MLQVFDYGTIPQRRITCETTARHDCKLEASDACRELHADVLMVEMPVEAVIGFRV